MPSIERTSSSSTRTRPPGRPVTEDTRPSTSTLLRGTDAHEGQSGACGEARKVSPRPSRKNTAAVSARRAPANRGTIITRANSATPSTASRSDTNRPARQEEAADGKEATEVRPAWRSPKIPARRFPRLSSVANKARRFLPKHSGGAGAPHLSEKNGMPSRDPSPGG